MLHYQIEEMRETVRKLILANRPPETVMIKQAHAEHLKLAFKRSQPINEVKPSGLEIGIPYGSVVVVKLHDLYVALKGTNGVDWEEQVRAGRVKEENPGTAPGQTQDPIADHG